LEKFGGKFAALSLRGGIQAAAAIQNHWRGKIVKTSLFETAQFILDCRGPL